LFNVENPETQRQDKVSYTMTFPRTEVLGNAYAVCIMTVKNFKLECGQGNNSPFKSPTGAYQ